MKELIDCRFLQEEIKNNIRQEISELGATPLLKILQVGDRPDSNKYVNQKIKHCNDVGIKTDLVKLDTCTTEEFITYIEQLNLDQSVHGIIVQLPLPNDVNVRRVLDAIAPEKDIDCLTTTNMGLLAQGRPFVEPCTPLGVVTLLESLQYDVVGKDVLMIGRSEIVGKPLSMMLTTRNATVTLAHSKTKNLQDKINNADLIITAIGKAKYIVASNEKAFIVDVGINFENGKLVGDFNHSDSCFDKATRVPNGIGALTTAMVCYNTLKLWKQQQKAHVGGL